MTIRELNNILNTFPSLDVLVVGDFFLDRYLIVDPDFTEESLETGLPANQVTDIRNSPGAAGTVTSNLRALGIGRVRALGVIGDDGQGYDLKNALQATGVETAELVETSNRFTPTYTKIMNKHTGAEGERLDIKNRMLLTSELEYRIIDALRRLFPLVDAVMILDQVQEHNCGVLTDRVTNEICQLAQQYPDKVCLADSRTRIDAFKSVIIKVNRDEVLQIIAPDSNKDPDNDVLSGMVKAYAAKNGRPVFTTLGEQGIIAADEKQAFHVPGISVPGPIDIVGAGDSVSAAVVASLAAGASLADAALIGVLASSITIQQVGTTGTASPGQIIQRYKSVYA